jgi:hypothetical protein
MKIVSVAKGYKLHVTPSKYHNVKTVVDGITFHSKKEAARYQELKLLEKAGEITGLELQPRFAIDIKGVHICDYIGDFLYTENGKPVLEDCKGFKTPSYRLKKKLVKAIWKFDILES